MAGEHMEEKRDTNKKRKVVFREVLPPINTTWLWVLHPGPFKPVPPPSRNMEEGETDSSGSTVWDSGRRSHASPKHGADKRAGSGSSMGGRSVHSRASAGGRASNHSAHSQTSAGGRASNHSAHSRHTASPGAGIDTGSYTIEREQDTEQALSGGYRGNGEEQYGSAGSQRGRVRMATSFVADSVSQEESTGSQRESLSRRTSSRDHEGATIGGSRGPESSGRSQRESGAEGSAGRGVVHMPSQGSLLSSEEERTARRQDSQSLQSEQQQPSQSERYIPSPLEAARSTGAPRSGSGSRGGLLDLVPAPLDHDDVPGRDNEGSERGSEATSEASLTERVRNAEPMLRQGSEFNLLGTRYGSMQSIPEHEPANPSDVFGSEVCHIKKSSGSVRTVSTGLVSTQHSEDPGLSACSFYDDIPSEANASLRQRSGQSVTRSGGRTRPRGVVKDSLATESVMTEESNLFGGGGARRRWGEPSEGTVPEEGHSQAARGPRQGSVNSTTSSAFIRAAEKGDVNAVRKALDNPNLDPDRKTKYQARSALHLAAGYGQYGVAEELLYAGADPVALSQTGRTPLHEACAGGHEKVLQLLLDYTRDFDLKDADGRTPSHAAAFHGEVQCLEVLVDKGAAQIIQDKAGRQPAHLAAMRDHRAILEYLYDKGIDLACRDTQGKLPVHYAAQYGALDLLICLVERECDITLPDNHGNLPIHFAAWNDHLDCVRFLIKQGTSMEVTQSDGRTPAHVAAAHGSYKVLHWLCSKGANVDALDNKLNTPLHLAGEAGKAKCFNCLLQHDSDLQAVNCTNDTPFNSAKKAGHKLAIEKSISNESPCPLCKQKFEFEEWEDLNGPSPVVRRVTQMGKKAFINPVPKVEKTKTSIEVSAERRRAKLVKRKQSKLAAARQSSALGGGTAFAAGASLTFLTQPDSETSKKRLPRRDLAAKYFGEHLTNDMYKLKV